VFIEVLLEILGSVYALGWDWAEINCLGQLMEISLREGRSVGVFYIGVVTTFGFLFHFLGLIRFGTWALGCVRRVLSIVKENFKRFVEGGQNLLWWPTCEGIRWRVSSHLRAFEEELMVGSCRLHWRVSHHRFGLGVFKRLARTHLHFEILTAIGSLRGDTSVVAIEH
jgi:hypothetical protein